MNINDAMNLLNLNGQIFLADLKKAYRVAASKYHPDKNPAGHQMMQAINEAYKTLKDLVSDEISVSYTGSNDAYDFGELLNVALNELLKLEGLILEICGNWIWVSGETKANKDAIAKIGCRYSGPKKMWYYRPEEFRTNGSKGAKSMDEIRAKYGSESVRTSH